MQMRLYNPEQAGRGGQDTHTSAGNRTSGAWPAAGTLSLKP